LGDQVDTHVAGRQIESALDFGWHIGPEPDMTQLCAVDWIGPEIVLDDLLERSATITFRLM